MPYVPKYTSNRRKRSIREHALLNHVWGAIEEIILLLRDIDSRLVAEMLEAHALEALHEELGQWKKLDEDLKKRIIKSAEEKIIKGLKKTRGEKESKP